MIRKVPPGNDHYRAIPSMSGSDNRILSYETRVYVDDDNVLYFLIVPHFELMSYS